MRAFPAFLSIGLAGVTARPLSEMHFHRSKERGLFLGFAAWNEAEHDDKIDQRLAHHHRGDTEREQAPEIAAAAECDRKAIDEDQRVEREKHESADQAEFLGEHRENEIGLAFRQET